MMEPEGVSPCPVEALPIVKRSLQHHICANDIRLDEGAGAFNRTIDVAFRRQMHDDIGPEGAQRLGDRGGIADIGPNELKSRAIGDRRQ